VRSDVIIYNGPQRASTDSTIPSHQHQRSLPPPLPQSEPSPLDEHRLARTTHGDGATATEEAPRRQFSDEEEDINSRLTNSSSSDW